MDELWESYYDLHPQDESEIAPEPQIVINDPIPWFNDPLESIDFMASHHMPIMVPIFYTKLVRESDKMWFVEVDGIVRKFSKNRSKIDKRSNCIMVPDWVGLKIKQ